MDTIIAAPTSCKVSAVICFLYTEGQSTAEIHRRLCRVYGDNVMSDSCVREWCRKFRDGRTDVHDEGGQVRHSFVTDETKSTNACAENVVSRYQSFLKNFHKLRGLLYIKLSQTDWVTTRSVHGGYQNDWPTWQHNLVALFFEEGLQKLVSRYDKCLNVDGSYVEKYRSYVYLTCHPLAHPNTSHICFTYTPATSMSVIKLLLSLLNGPTPTPSPSFQLA
jgi:hypothetical protein